MVNRKTVLVTIIVLLIIFLPLTITSFFIRYQNPFEENKKHEFKYDDKLWFYNEDNELLGKYECNTEKCDYAKSVFDDEDYHLNYLKDGDIKGSVLLNNYVFIEDGLVVNLYNLKTNKIMQSYENIKTYNIANTKDAYILKNKDGKWGVIGMGEVIRSILPFEYDFIGLSKKIELNKLKSDIFVVKKGDNWLLVDDNNSALTTNFTDEIIDYNNNYVALYHNGEVKITSYKGDNYLSNYYINKVYILDNYLGIVSNNNLLLFNDLNNGYLKSYPLDNIEDEISFTKEDGNLIIKIKETIRDTIALNG